MSVTVLLQSDTDVIACWAPDPLVHPQVHDGWIKPGDRFYTEDDRVRHLNGYV